MNLQIFVIVLLHTVILNYSTMKTILVDAVDTFVIEWEWINRDLYSLLESYPNPKIIVTNANDEQAVEFGLIDMPYEIFSMKHNPDKVDSLYFTTLFKKYKLQADDVVYFEHSREACESAQSLWIKTHFYDMVKKDLVALKEFLDRSL